MRVVFGLSVMDQRVFRTVMRAADFIAGDGNGSVIENGFNEASEGPWFEPSALADPKLMIVGVLTEINKFVIRILREYCADYTFAWYREDTQRTLWAATGDETLPIIRASHCNINDGERLPILSFKLECNYIIKGNGLEAAPDHHTVMFTDRGAGRTWEGVLSYVSAKGHSQIISVDDRVETTAFLRDLLVGPSARA